MLSITGVERSDEREVDVVAPEAANDRVVEPQIYLPLKMPSFVGLPNWKRVNLLEMPCGVVIRCCWKTKTIGLRCGGSSV